MEVMETFESRIRVFKWDVKIPEELQAPPLSTSEAFGSLFVLRATVDLSEERSWLEAATYMFSMDDAMGFGDLGTRQELLSVALNSLYPPRSFKNLESVAQKIAEKLHCQFCFSPEILSGQGSKLVVLLDLDFPNLRRFDEISDYSDSVVDDDDGLEVPIGGRSDHEASDSGDSNADNMDIASDSVNYDDKVAKQHCAAQKIWDHGYNLGVEEIEDILNNCYGIDSNTDDPNALHEVEACLQFKVSGGDLKVKRCSICLERLSKGMQIVETPCSHIFHMPCMSIWLQKRNSCPLCRSACAVYV